MLKHALLATTAVALSLATAASAQEGGWQWTEFDGENHYEVDHVVGEAHTFENVVENEFTTDAFIDSNIHADLNIETEYAGFFIDPLSSSITISNFQKFFGNADATVTISGDFAGTGAEEGGVLVPVQGQFSGEADLSDVEGTSTINANETANVVVDPPGNQDLPFLAELGGAEGTVDFEDGTTAPVTGEFVGFILIPDAADATTQLAAVLGNATAAGNILTIKADQHADFEFALLDHEYGFEPDEYLYLNNDQQHLRNIYDLTDGQDGHSPDITATATAGDANDPVEAAVNLNATAVSNLLSVDMPNAAVVVASTAQTSWADVSASASSNQDLTAFYNLGLYDGLHAHNISSQLDPSVPDMVGVVTNLSATAVGNIATFNLGDYAALNVGGAYLPNGN